MGLWTERRFDMTKSMVWQRSRCWKRWGWLKNGPEYWLCHLWVSSHLLEGWQGCSVRAYGELEEEVLREGEGVFWWPVDVNNTRTSESSHFYRNVWILHQGMRAGYSHPLSWGCEWWKNTWESWKRIATLWVELSFNSGKEREVLQPLMWAGMKREASTSIRLGHSL